MFLVAAAGQCFAESGVFNRPISDIQVSGNEKTQERFILKWAGLNPGDTLTAEKFELARQNILDTSLFKRVDLTTTDRGNRVGVGINVEEKYFTLLVPRLSRSSDGDIKSGIRLKMHNIGGANQTLKMLVEQTDLSNGNDDQRYRIDYLLPQFSKPYYFRWRLGQSEKNTFNEGFVNTEYYDYIGFAVERDLKTSLFDYPLTLSNQIRLERLQLEQSYPVSFNEAEAGKFSYFGVEVSYDAVHQHYFRRTGRRFSLSYQQGLSELGSDYHSRIIAFESIVFRPLNSLDNINSRIFIGTSHRSPFNTPYFDLGGANNVRGVERDAFSGDALAFANFEYVIGYRKYPSLRNSLFVDIGNVYQDAQSIDPGDVHYSIGAGIRWKLTSFIKTDLFIDVAYQPESSETFVYGGTSLNF